VLQRANRRPEALDAYSRALEVSPDDPDALFNRAKLELLENDLKAARRDVDHLLAKHKEYAAAEFLEAHLCMAEGNNAGAKDALTKFLALPQTDPRMKAAATDMLQKLGG
jgi:tetratricopeptide (TPR) repeat protein